MPMYFPNMKSLSNRAAQRGFRQPHEGEEEDVYRAAFATFMRDVDLVESLEIADGRGWDAQGPATLMAGLMRAKPEIRELVDEIIHSNQEASTKPKVPDYPHVMITCSRDEEIHQIYMEKEAEEMIELLAVFMATSPVVRTSEIFKSQITEIESMSAAASRVVVSRMLTFIEEGNENPMLQKLANQLAARMLVSDTPLRIAISKQLEPDEVYEDGFALPA